jgi:hypothetical protein
MQSETNIPAAPAGYATVNPFVITHDVDGLIDFLKQVFRVTERPEARTLDDDGLLLHAELAIGNATIMFAERKPGWPFTPASSRCTSTTSTPPSRSPASSARRWSPNQPTSSETPLPVP